MEEYWPFAYPPDYKLARIHKEATRPGRINPHNTVVCPCCQQFTRSPLKQWFKRIIEHDFKDYGGAIVTYFWLVKVYIATSFLVLLLYSIFLMYTIHRACQQKTGGCQKFLGLDIITNAQLFDIMERLKWEDSIAQVLTLRSIAYVILLLGNIVALYVSGRFKRRYPQPKNIHHFSLIFKNVSVNHQVFREQLTSSFADLDIKELFVIKKMEPYYTLYNQRMEKYYQCLIQQDSKKKAKMLQQLSILEKRCQQNMHNYDTNSDRIIVVFHSEIQRNIVMESYQLKGIQKAKYLIGFTNSIKQRVYCEKCPIPSEIIWNNLGQNERQKIKLKVISVAYFILIIVASYFFLFFCMKLVYDRSILPDPWNGIAANIIMTALIFIALTFRAWMGKLSEMRRPNTQTSRTMFIVLTTVLFHIICYIIIPTFYLVEHPQEDDENTILRMITNSTFNFLLVQSILAYYDLMFCSWTKKLKKIEDQQKPIGNQKILHQNIQFPRFPIQFKLIILFKVFSFILLFAFESPLILFLCFGLLVFLYFKDKHSLYHHYRMQIISNDVQFSFLKVYSVLFSFYTFLIYLLTQLKQKNIGSQRAEKTKVEIYVALGFMIISMIIQIFYIKDQTYEDETIEPSTLQKQNIRDSYIERYQFFRKDITNEVLDVKIYEYLSQHGHGSLQTEESLQKRGLISGN